MSSYLDFKKIQNFTLFGSLALVTVLFLWMVHPYFYPIFWAAVLAALFQPINAKLKKAWKLSGSLSAAVTELVIVLCIVLPLGVVISIVIQEILGLYHTFGNYQTFLSFQSSITKMVHWLPIKRVDVSQVITDQLAKFGSAASNYLYDWVTNSGQNTMYWVLTCFVMLYSLFFFLRDGEQMLKKLMHLLPLGDTYEKQLYQRFVSTARATLRGTFLIACVQGFLGAIDLWIAQIPGAAFWGVVMVVFACIPGIGSMAILVPTAIILVVTGAYWQAGVVVVGAFIAWMIDSFVRGPVVGHDIKMHSLLICCATIGGLATFGISGIVMGPVIAAFLVNLWKIYEEKYQVDLEREG